MLEREYIRLAMFEKNDGGVETTITVDCPHCGTEFDKEVEPSGTGFFFPSRVRKR